MRFGERAATWISPIARQQSSRRERAQCARNSSTAQAIVSSGLRQPNRFAGQSDQRVQRRRGTIRTPMRTIGHELQFIDRLLSPSRGNRMTGESIQLFEQLLRNAPGVRFGFDVRGGRRRCCHAGNRWFRFRGVMTAVLAWSCCGNAAIGSLGPIIRKLEAGGSLALAIDSAAGKLSGCNCRTTDDWLDQIFRTKSCNAPERTTHRITASETEYVTNTFPTRWSAKAISGFGSSLATAICESVVGQTSSAELSGEAVIGQRDQSVWRQSGPTSNRIPLIRDDATNSSIVGGGQSDNQLLLPTSRAGG